MNMRAMYIQRSVDVVMGMRKTADAGITMSMGMKETADAGILMSMQTTADAVMSMGMKKTADAVMSISVRNMHMSRESAGWKIMRLTM